MPKQPRPLLCHHWMPHQSNTPICGDKRWMEAISDPGLTALVTCRRCLRMMANKTTSAGGQ